MYDIALSAAACSRSKTRAYVAWMTSPVVSDEALLFTPGGGRIGVLHGGAFDGVLGDIASRGLTTGRHAVITIGPVESATTGMQVSTQASFLVIPVDQFPVDTWAWLMERRRFAVDATLDSDEVVDVTVVDSTSAIGQIAEALASGETRVDPRDGGIVTVFSPKTRFVIAGQGPVAEPLAAAATSLGWKVAAESRPDLVMGLTATLTWMDGVVIMGHDVEQSGRNLMAALDSDAGYIGALGSRKMQEDRAQWLAYRDVTDVSRVHGPAGLPIGAATPAEIAVSVLAEAIAALRGAAPDA